MAWAWLLLIFTRIQIFEQGDTLIFMDGDRRQDVLIFEETTQPAENGGTVTLTRKARASDDRRSYFIFEQSQYTQPESVFTRVTLYTADRKPVRTETRAGERRIAFELTRLFGNRLVLGTVDRDYSRPRLDLLEPGRSGRTLIAEDAWPKIAQYEISPNFRFMVLHARRLINGRMMDFVAGRDLKSGQEWEYAFPICLTCRRGTITIRIDNQGGVETVYKNEHRIFNRSGEMIDLYLETE